MRELEVGGRRLDVGPTVFTMRSVFEDIFSEAGAALSSMSAFSYVGSSTNRSAIPIPSSQPSIAPVIG